MLSWQHLCISLFIKEWSHMVRLLFLSFLSNLCSIMVNMSLHSEKWRGDGGRLSTCCAMLSRWIPLGTPRSSADGDLDICSVSGYFCAEPSQAGRGMRVRDELEGTAVTTRVSQAESLTPSCCLSLLPNSKWFCEVLNPTDFFGCIPLQTSEQPSPWVSGAEQIACGWDTCLDLLQSREDWILAKFPSTSLGRELNAQGVCCSPGPALKRMIRNGRKLLTDWNPKQKNHTVLKKGGLHTLKAEW